MTLVCVHCENKLVLAHNKDCKSVQEKNIWPSFCFPVQGENKCGPHWDFTPTCLAVKNNVGALYERTTPSPHSLSLITCGTNKEPSISFSACSSEGVCALKASSPGGQLLLQNAECEKHWNDTKCKHFFFFTE